MRDSTTTKLTNEQLDPLASFVRSRPGGLTEIVNRMNRATGKKWDRSSIERWLHPRKSKRIQPLFGAGLLLVQVCKEFRIAVDVEVIASRRGAHHD